MISYVRYIEMLEVTMDLKGLEIQKKILEAVENPNNDDLKILNDALERVKVLKESGKAIKRDCLL